LTEPLTSGGIPAGATTGSPFKRGEFLLIDLDRFQGPLDLLLHLIRQQDIDIFDIPIATITEQFLAAIQGAEVEDLDGAGEFLEMAATLIRIKAQMLLPRPRDDEDEDPRAELVRRLLEYEQIREISSRLANAEAERGRRHGKGYVEPRPRGLLEDTPLETSWEEVMEAAMGVELPHPSSRAHRITTGFVPLEEKIQLILDRLREVARVEFSRLLEPWNDRMHGVMTLLAGLELSRQRAVTLRQARLFSELWILRRDLEAWLDDPAAEDEEGLGAGPARAPEPEEHPNGPDGEGSFGEDWDKGIEEPGEVPEESEDGV
jgi:segregation and condensation protein A